MIGLDTNVVIRLLTGDDPNQQRIARMHVRANCSVDDPAWINRIVAAEVVWVLERSYRFSHEQISEALEKLLNTAEILFEDHDLVRAALIAYRKGAGFADALIDARNRQAGCSVTITFDTHAAKRLTDFTLLPSS